MPTPAGRRDLTAAYADLVSGLLDARNDAATERFDAELATAESEGRLDARTARSLRWWQRESVRALVDHGRAALPPALSALDHAHAEGAESAAGAAQAWERALADRQPPPQHAQSEGAPQSMGAEPPNSLRDRRRRLIVAGLRPLPRKE